MNLLELNKNCLTNILKFLDVNDLSNIKVVCKLFNQLYESEIIWMFKVKEYLMQEGELKLPNEFSSFKEYYKYFVNLRWEVDESVKENLILTKNNKKVTATKQTFIAIATESKKIEKGKMAYRVKRLSNGYVGVGLSHEDMKYYDIEHSSDKLTKVYYKNGASYSEGLRTYFKKWKVGECVSILLDMDKRKAELWNEKELLTTWDISPKVKWMRLDGALISKKKLKIMPVDFSILKISPLWNNK